MKIRNILSVDWDFFFPEYGWNPKHPYWLLYDWGHREAPFFINGVWDSRAEGFLHNNLPLPGLSGEQTTFWNRFYFRRGAKLYTAESHSQCVQQDWLQALAVWNYDAHHDLGYHKKDIDQVLKGVNRCDNWLLTYTLLGVKVEVRYPYWKTRAVEVETRPPCLPSHLENSWVRCSLDDGATSGVEFDAVFVCRSGAWVPPWLDSEYQLFLNSCPLKQVELQPLVKRTWNEQEVRNHMQFVDKYMELTTKWAPKSHTSF
jgi:hypothetical protein